MDGRALVGRERELAAVDEAIRRAIAGERAVVMLTGEPGIGKSTLLEALATRVLAAGGTAAWGRTSEVGLTPAFWPWIELLGALETADDPAPKLGSLDQRADASTRLLRFEEVVAYVARRARQAPIAILLDDAHAADPSSLQLLEHAVPRWIGAPVVVAIAARDGDASADVATALGRIQRGARRLPLGRLGREDVDTLVGQRVEPSASARVWELSDGNPLFVEELVASLASHGVARLPHVSSVRAVIRDRIARLPAATGAALAAASVVGREFRGAIVAAMLGVAAHEIVAQLGPAVRLGMVSTVTIDRYRYSHALIAEVVADELEPSERARLHLRAARAIELRDRDDAGGIAHHLLAAGHLAAEAAVHAAERAAAAAMSQLAFEDAAAMLERAIAALALAAPGDRHRHATLLCSWAEALQHAAQHGLAGVRCDEAMAIARDLGDGELLARIALVRGIEFRYGRTDPSLVLALREAASALGMSSPALRAKLLARLAAAEQPARDPTVPVAHARAALELARDLPDRDRLDVLYTAMAAMVEYVPAAELEPIHREVLALATAAKAPELATHSLVRLCFAAIERGDRPAFEAAVAELRGRATALGIPRWLRALHLLDALEALLDGRFAAAEEAAARAERLSTDEQSRWLLHIHRALAAYSRTVPIPRASRDAMLEHPPLRLFGPAWFAAQDLDHEAARAALAGIGDELPTDRDLLFMLAVVVTFAGTAEQAGRIYSELLARRGQIIMATMVGSAVFDIADRVLLMLAARCGRWEDVEAHARVALALAARLRSPVWTARIRAAWADALELRAGAEDRTRAGELRAQVLAVAEPLGMTLLVRQCQGPSGPAPLPSPPPAPSPRGDRVSFQRVGELWLVRGFGEETHVKASRGMEMLARLVAEPGRELHALELAGSSDPVDGGDAGEVLDATARAAYRDRMKALIAVRDEAEAWADVGRAERATAEIETLTAELARALGAGGRERRVGAASERARSNVQRRLNHAIQQIRAASRPIGEHLAASIKTGTCCVYHPG